MSECVAECIRLSQVAWDAVLRGFDDANFVQSWSHGAARHGEKHLRHFVLREAGRIIGAAQAVVLKAPVLGCGIAHVKWGPMWRPAGYEAGPGHFLRLLCAMHKHFVEERGLLLRVSPWEFEDDPVRADLGDAGFRPSVYAPRQRTAVVDLRHTLEELRASLTRHWRKNLKIAEANNLEVVEGSSAELLDHFLTLHAEMRRRKDGWIPAAGFFRRAYQCSSERMKPHISICFDAGKPIAGLVVSSLGTKALPLFAATGDRGLELRGAYLLQWRAIERLRAMGIQLYDLAGINEKTHPGPAQFKLGLIGKLGWQADYLGEFDACKSKSSEALVGAGGYLYDAFKRLQKGLRRRRQDWPRAGLKTRAREAAVAETQTRDEALTVHPAPRAESLNPHA